MMNLNASLDDAVTSSSSFTALLELPPTQVVKLLRDETQPHALHPFTDSIVQLLNHNLENLNYHTAVPDPPLEDEFEVRTLSVKGKKLPEKRKKRIKEEEKEDDEEEVVRGPKGRKRSKKEEIGQSQLPYVHVRARRGQATDSHSLAERARREKINARMKLLQELVPGCSKISGIALVLDEIINHVQALQRQVEFLSMQLAAVNPRIEFNLDQLMDDENAVVECSLLSVKQPLEWTDPQGNGLSGFKCSFGQQWQCDAYQHPQWLKEENNQLESVAMPDTAHLRNASSPEMGCVFLRQLKVEQT